MVKFANKDTVIITGKLKIIIYVCVRCINSNLTWETVFKEHLTYLVKWIRLQE